MTITLESTRAYSFVEPLAELTVITNGRGKSFTFGQMQKFMPYEAAELEARANDKAD